LTIRFTTEAQGHRGTGAQGHRGTENIKDKYYWVRKEMIAQHLLAWSRVFLCVSVSLW